MNTKQNKANNQIKQIVIIGRRWFEKTNGNTYHSVEVYIDGNFLEKTPFQYGYSDQYRQTAQEILIKHKITTDPQYYILARDKRFKVIYSVSDVARKGDL